MTKLPYFSRLLPALRGGETLYDRMVDVFDLAERTAYTTLPEILAAMDSDAALNIGVVSQEVMGATEILDFYVDGVYLFMLYDWTRTVGYENALAGHLRRDPALRRTLEIGCGAYPLLSWMLYEAGASDLTVCEVNPASFESARTRFATKLPHVSQGDRLAVLKDDRGARLTMHNRYSTELELADDERFDLYVHEILGPIASMEGCVDVFNQTLDLLADDAVCVPSRALTYCAPISRFELASDNRERLGRIRSLNPELQHFFPAEPTLTTGSLHYVMNLPAESLIAPGQPFEDFDFTRREPLPLQQSRVLSFTPDRPSALDGLALYMEVHTDDSTRFDSLTSQTSWVPLYVRLFDEPVPVAPDTHEIQVFADYDVSIANMSYAFRVVVLEKGEAIAEGRLRLKLS